MNTDHNCCTDLSDDSFPIQNISDNEAFQVAEKIMETDVDFVQETMNYNCNLDHHGDNNGSENEEAFLCKLMIIMEV